MGCLQTSGTHLRKGRLRRTTPPTPGVAKPSLWQQDQRCCLGSAIVDSDAHEHVVRVGLGVLHKNVEVMVIGEDAGIDQLELGIVQSAPLVFLQKLLVGKGSLWILVEHPRVGARRSRIKVVVKFLDVLAMVAFSVGQPEKALLEDRVLPIPQRDAEAESFFFVAEAGKAILAPTISAAAGVLVGKIFPSRTVGTIVLANRTPLALAKVSAPTTPRFGVARGFVKTNLFGVGYRFWVGWSGCGWHCWLGNKLQH